ncbi:MAG TPA: BatD family protein [Verrucomicrobiae bacterium]|nr:BatD family protein [Verrucomicrobiae bacterium]
MSLQPVIRARIRAAGFQLSLLLAFLFCLIAPTTVSAAVTFTASVNPQTITQGESATLSLAFENATPSDVPELPNIPNLEIAYVGPSTEMRYFNGVSSSKTTYNYTIAARQPGDFTIPALSVVVDGKTLRSAPLHLKVVPAGSSVSGGNSGDALAQVKLVLPKKTAYVGEVLTAQLQLYLHSSIQNVVNFQITDSPAEGMNIGKQVETQHSRAQIGNSIYTVVPLAFPITPVKSGLLTVGPINVQFVAELPSPNRRRDPFDPFGMFNRNEQKQLTLATDAQSIQVSPLPENAPAGFAGAVGVYTMTMTAGPTNVAVGDPITIKVQIAGRGALDSVALPDQPSWKEFKIYPATSKIDTTDPLGIQGTKSFEQVIVPQNDDIKALPPFAFSYFDPEQKSYRTLVQPAIPLTIRPSGSTPVPTVAANRPANDNTPPPAQDIVSIKQRIGDLVPPAPALVRQSWFLALQSVPLLAFLGAVGFRKRQESLANNPRLRRQRQVTQWIREGLNDLRKQADANNSDAFFATVFRLLQEQLGERLDVPASSITEAVIDERLRPKGISEPLLNALHELFQSCNLARYAPIKSSQELAAMIPKVESTLSQLREVTL